MWTLDALKCETFHNAQLPEDLEDPAIPVHLVVLVNLEDLAFLEHLGDLADLAHLASLGDLASPEM